MKPVREWSTESKADVAQAVAAVVQGLAQSMAVTQALIVKLAQRKEER